MEGLHENNGAKESSGRSPRSPLSTYTRGTDSMDLTMDGAIDTSIEQLYNNVHEMQSSDNSPSSRSLMSYGGESRIDSELQFLAGVDHEEMEEGKEVVEETGDDRDDKKGDGDEICTRKIESEQQEKRRNRMGLIVHQKQHTLELICLNRPSSYFRLETIHKRLDKYAVAIPLLERSIEVPLMDLGENHALAKFSGCMQLGDTYAMLGQIENSILCYTAGMEIQRQVLGEGDTRFGETCRYLAEAHVQAMQFDEAEKMCQIALDIHKEKCVPASPEEAADRRLLGLICDAKGDYEAALEHYVLASTALAANGHELDVASVDCNIGDAYLSLAKYDEAISAYQKALKTFKAAKGENHPSIASVFVRLADLYNKIGKFSESKSYCEKSLRIYKNPTPGSPAEEIASGLVDVSAIFESMDEPEKALKLLQKAIKVYGKAPGQQSTIAGIKSQMGVLYYMMGSYTDSYNTLKEAIAKFRAIGEKKSALLGIALNQVGLACVQLYAINEAADYFEESRYILEAECGPHHADTIGVYSNLAGTYDAMGRTTDAIEILEFVVGMREEKLGTANPDVDDEKRRLSELLKEAGRVRNWKSRSLETLLVKNSGVVGDTSKP
ncbi:hypothetical protein Leryth_001692 [Lithospermum erythrorhizon]|nr:hypothetical protein Leryth_001692 [Lithospermum erythrorhizon]